MKMSAGVLFFALGVFSPQSCSLQPCGLCLPDLGGGVPSQERRCECCPLKFQMAQQCIQDDYFDKLLNACTPCHLRCSNSPPLTCQHYCNAMKRTNTILWTCLGLSLLVSLTLFVLMFLLRKMRSEPLKDEIKSTGSALQNEANADLENRKDSGTGAEVLSRGLEYTVEECTCEDCVKSKLKLPALPGAMSCFSEPCSLPGSRQPREPRKVGGVLFGRRRRRTRGLGDHSAFA
ncbi:Tumor necrosis factor receptor superfamily member 17 [Pteropus alecto]|uniref:Tumor necrosis factor receptor superfamily member 17 n=1 Tax=Pteropus alecto TaxID=9402 RepID=L5KQA5_PTEAL|nr:Tumor necrosis factor receptor superfamily member 17 [Pteropus alecto]